MHLARIASIESRREAMDTLMRRLLALGTAAEVLETRAFRAFALGDREAWKRVTRELMDNPPDVPAVTALQVATYLDDVDGAERFAHLLADSRYSDDVRGMAHRLLARVAVARGGWRAARALLDSAGRFDPVAELELRSLLAVLRSSRCPAGSDRDPPAGGRVAGPDRSAGRALPLGRAHWSAPRRAALSAGAARRQSGRYDAALRFADSLQGAVNQQRD